MIGQNSPLSQLVAVTDQLKAVASDVAELKRLNSVATATSGVYVGDGAAVTTATVTAVTLTATSDPRGWLSGGDVVPDLPGWYRVSVAVQWPNVAYTTTMARVRLNGSGVDPSDYRLDSGANPNTNIAVVFVECNGTSDAIDVAVFQDNGVSRTPTALQVGVEHLPGH